MSRPCRCQPPTGLYLALCSHTCRFCSHANFILPSAQVNLAEWLQVFPFCLPCYSCWWSRLGPLCSWNDAPVLKIMLLIGPNLTSLRALGFCPCPLWNTFSGKLMSITVPSGSWGICLSLISDNLQSSCLASDSLCRQHVTHGQTLQMWIA